MIHPNGPLHKLYLIVLFFAVLLEAAGCGSEKREDGAATRAQRPDDLEPPFRAPPRVNPLDAANQPKIILFILVDTLRPDYLGCYGSDRGLTPNMDFLAESSYLFENALAPSSWTRPSVASIFTSCYPGAIGVHTMEDRLPEDLLTLAEVLKIHGGYYCVGVTTNGNSSREIGFAQGFDRYIFPTQTKQGYPGDFKLVTADIVTQMTLRDIPKWLEEAGNKPMFLFLHYVDPHDPYMPHPELMERPEPKGRFNGSRKELKEADRLARSNELTQLDRDRIEYLYSGEVRYSDLWVGNLFKGLLKRIGAENLSRMLLILTADHGEGLWDHGDRQHGHIPYEEQIHVPLLVKLPGMLPGDAIRIPTPVSLIDLAPTLSKLCGIPKPLQFQGHDLMPIMKGESRPLAMEPVFSEVRHASSDHDCLVWGRKKVIRDRTQSANSKKATQLFDLEDDPGERNNLNRAGKSVKWSYAIKKLLGKWANAVKSGDQFTNQVDWDELDERTRESLRALGYAAGK